MEKILIVRLSAIGDLVMASPLIGALRRSRPEAHIAWLSEEGSGPVLEANTDLDELIIWPRNRWRILLRKGHLLSLAREVSGFIRSLRRRKFDLAIDAQGLLKSGIWVFLSGAPERIGIGSREGSRFLMTRVISREAASDRVSSQYYLLAKTLDLDIGSFEMKVSISDEAASYASDFAAGVGSGFIAVAPFTTRPQKHWLEERWIETARKIRDDMNMAVVILGGPGDMEAADRMAEAVGERCFTLAGKTTIQESAAIIERSSILIGVDTGLTHMGIALKVPTLALFGATRPYLDTRGTTGRVIYHGMECSPCRRSPTCNEEFTCMHAITSDEVVGTALKLLEEE